MIVLPSIRGFIASHGPLAVHIAAAFSGRGSLALADTVLASNFLFASFAAAGAMNINVRQRMMVKPVTLAGAGALDINMKQLMKATALLTGRGHPAGG